jgi:hypothetical protein
MRNTIVATSVAAVLVAGMILSRQTATHAGPPPSVSTHQDTIPVIGHEYQARAVASGDWSQPEIWETGTIPLEGDSVYIPLEIEVSITGSVVEIENIIVDGSLELDMSELTVGTLTVLPEGTLTCGTEDQPGEATIIFSDQEIDLVADPFQFGRGMLIFGTISMHGQPVTPFVRCADGLSVGATSSAVLSQPEGWTIGDDLVVTDTRQGYSKGLLKRKKWIPHCDEVELMASSGGIVSFSPLEFGHLRMHNPHDDRPLTAHILNLSRSIVFRNEDDAKRGHTMFLASSTVDVNYCRSINIGRTDGSKNLVPGESSTNQIARYAWHFHHHHGGLAQMRGCATSGALKWGYTIHGSNGVQFVGNIAYDCLGAGLMLEDGSEIECEIIGNFFCKITKGGRTITKLRDGDGVRFLDTARDGSGLWMRGCHNIVKNNISNACEKAGYMNNGYYSGKDVDHRGYIEWDNNEVYGYTAHGFWRGWPQGGSVSTESHGYMGNYAESPSIQHRNLGWGLHVNGSESWHDAAYEQHDCVYINDIEATNKRVRNFNTGCVGISYRTHYTAWGAVVDNCHVYNFHTGVELPLSGGDEETWGPTLINKGTLVNHVNIYGNDYKPGNDPLVAEVHETAMGHPGDFVSFSGYGRQYDVALVPSGHKNHKPLDHLIAEVRLFGYDGRDILVHYAEQHPGFFLLQSDYRRLPAEVDGLTNQEAWDSLGVCFHGELTDHEEELPEIQGLVKEIE